MAEVTQVQMQESGPNDPSQGAVLRFQERPDWVPEKFFKEGEVNMQDVLKSYAELEKLKGGQPQTQPQQTKQPEQKQPEQAPVQIPGVSQEASTKYVGELQKDGKLSDGSYEELSKAGYPKDMVDAYLRGLNHDAAVQQDRLNVQESQRIIDSIGGSEKYSEMVGWAAQNLSEAEINAYNSAVQSGNMESARFAIEGLKARFTQANGQDLNLLGGEGGAPSGASPYGSVFEMTEDIRSHRYKNDEGFRQKVAQRIKASSIF